MCSVVFRTRLVHINCPCASPAQYNVQHWFPEFHAAIYIGFILPILNLQGTIMVFMNITYDDNAMLHIAYADVHFKIASLSLSK